MERRSNTRSFVGWNGSNLSFGCKCVGRTERCRSAMLPTASALLTRSDCGPLHSRLNKVKPEKPEERSPHAMRTRVAVLRGNYFTSRQALHGAVNNRAKFDGVLRLAPHCQSAACFVDTEPGGIAVLFFGRLGMSNVQ